MGLEYYMVPENKEMFKKTKAKTKTPSLRAQVEEA